jgi:hypothetical protein
MSSKFLIYFPFIIFIAICVWYLPERCGANSIQDNRKIENKSNDRTNKSEVNVKDGQIRKRFFGSLRTGCMGFVRGRSRLRRRLLRRRLRRRRLRRRRLRRRRTRRRTIASNLFD